jgi:CubicO group peptidase (beta-lactamase class C family)
MAGGPASECPYNFTNTEAAIFQFRAMNPAVNDNIGFAVARSGVLVEQAFFGPWDEDTPIPIASASKWIFASIMMALVDDGTLSLDDSIGQYLPEYGAGNLSLITVRQCLSHTSGLPGQSQWISNDTISMREAATRIAQAGLRATPGGGDVLPGTDFVYGGVSMHVAAAAAEVAAGQPFSRLAQERLFGPLGMTNTTFGSTQNPRVAGGAVSTVHDYLALVDMHRQNGLFAGERVLSEAACIEMRLDQTNGVPIVSSPEPAWRYGLGLWRDVVDSESGEAIRVSSPGAFGFTPWLEVDSGLVGVISYLRFRQEIAALTVTIQDETRQVVLASPDVVPDGVVDFSDLNLILTTFGTEGTADLPRPVGDLDGDGRVGFFELNAVLTAFGRGC